MAADIKAKYGANNQTITITFASLANDAKRESTVIDNTSNCFFAALVQLQVKTGSGTIGSNPVVNVYAYGTADGGTTYSGEATGTDAAYSGTVANCRLIGVISCPASATAYKSEPMNAANAFGGVLPDKWGIIVENKTGLALDGTEANHKKFYQGVYVQSV
jgi:hypothetical protein